MQTVRAQIRIGDLQFYSKFKGRSRGILPCIIKGKQVVQILVAVHHDNARVVAGCGNGPMIVLVIIIVKPWDSHRNNYRNQNLQVYHINIR